MTNRVGIKGRGISTYVRYFDPSGVPVEPDSTPRVEVTSPDGYVIRALSNSGVSSEADVDGLYRFDYIIPLSTSDGYASDRWVALIGGEEVEYTFQFLVQDNGSAVAGEEPTFSPTGTTTFTFTKCEAEGIDKLMTILKKRLKSDGTSRKPDPNNPAQYITVECPVFSNDELVCFLISSLSEFNAHPHFTGFTFCDPQITGIFADIIIQGAVLLGLAAQTLIEKGREFSINDNGITFQPPQVSDILNTQYNSQLAWYKEKLNSQLAWYKEKLKHIKHSIKPTIKSLGTYRITAISPAYMRLRHLRQKQLI